MKLAILNTSILTAFGAFDYKAIDLDEAIAYVQGNTFSHDGILSAIGHESTAAILTDLLKVKIPVNRINFAQEIGQRAIVFKLNGRPPEGKIFIREEIEEIGYEFGLLTRLS